MSEHEHYHHECHDDIKCCCHKHEQGHSHDEDHEDERVFPLEGDSADLEDIIRTVFVLNMDSKLLCKPDCQGLCCRCGKNLNEGKCDCQKELDPRFAALRQLLDK